MFQFRKILRAFGEQENVEVGEVDGVRSMYLGSATIQSSMRLKAPYDLELAYSRGMMLFLLFAPHIKQVLILGLGGGSLPKFLYHYLADVSIRVLELNPKVINIARTHFYLQENDDRLQVIEGDAVAYIQQNSETTEMLMLDLFDGNGIPPNMYSQDFFDACVAAIKPNGMFAVNLWGSDKNFDIYLQRIEQSFNDRVLVVPTGRPGNIVVMGFKRLPSELRWEQLRQKAKELDATLKLDFMGLLERIKDNNNNTPSRILME